MQDKSFGGISSWSEAEEKAPSWMTYVINPMRNRWLYEIQAVYFGLARTLLLENDPDAHSKFDAGLKAGLKPSACLAMAYEQKIMTKLAGPGLDAVFVGPLTRSPVEECHSLLKFRNLDEPDI